jgi:hypothetical protein
MRSTSVRLALVAVAFVAVAGSACGGSGYQYVKNDDLGIYARLPDDWTVFDEDDLFPDATERELDRQAQSLWVRVFDASEDPSIDAAENFDGPKPAGVVVARALTIEQREALDLAMLRGLGDPARNPLTRAETEPGYEVLLDEAVEYEGGFSGVHTVYVTAETGSRVVVDQTALRDSSSSAIVMFVVGCEEECYADTHKDEIADLVDSWTIQEVRS